MSPVGAARVGMQRAPVGRVEKRRRRSRRGGGRRLRRKAQKLASLQLESRQAATGRGARVLEEAEAEESASTGAEGMLEKGAPMRETGEGKENAVRLKGGEANAAMIKDRVERAADGNDGGPANVAAAEVDGGERASAAADKDQGTAFAAESGGHYWGSQLWVGSPRVLSTLDRQKLPTAVYCDRGRWLVEALVLGDGSDGRNALVFRRGVLHACAQATASVEAFHPIAWDAELFSFSREDEIVLSTYAVYGSCLDWGMPEREWPHCVIPARLRRVSRQPREDEVPRHVLAFLRKHSGLAVRNSGIGCRGSVNWPAEARCLLQGQPRRTAATHDCVRGALVNAVFALRGAGAADEVEGRIDEDPRIFSCFKPLGLILHGAREAFIQCRAVRDGESQRAIQSADRGAAFRVLAAKRSGIFIVRLQEVILVDHAVVVHADAGVIVESTETTAIVLTGENLERCGGEKVQRLRVVEVREIKGRE